MDETEAKFIESQRVAHMASADGAGAPHVVPICFVLEAGIIYTAIDAKPKRVEASRLRRVRNIVENPNVALVFDRYVEDWGRIGYVIVNGHGNLVEDEDERSRAEDALREKYPQYHELLPAGCPVIRIEPSHVVSWGNLEPDEASQSDQINSSP
jgi:PPOX class probable F420-dependent enzyme